MADIPDGSDKVKTMDSVRLLSKIKPHSSHALLNDPVKESKSGPQDNKISPYFRGNVSYHSGDLSFNFDNPPMRRSNSLEKRLIMDLGRSPPVPFV